MLYLLGYHLPAISLFWLGSVAPAAAAAGAVRFFPEARAWWHGLTVPLRSKWQEEDQKGHSWEADWVRELGSRQSSSGDSKQSSHQGSYRSDGGNRGDNFHHSSRNISQGDSKGYYSLLGVPRSASMSEIQAAFRAAAFQHHPDKSKSQSGERFQQIMEVSLDWVFGQCCPWTIVLYWCCNSLRPNL